MKTRHTLLAAGLLAATATVALAATAPASTDARGERWQKQEQRAAEMFTKTDSNHDGKISQSEWQAARLREASDKFRELDANRDGNLSHEELDNARDQRMAKRGEHMREKLMSLDTDGDQQLSRAEIGDKLPRLAEHFDRLDANGDGKLSQDELRAGRGHRGDDDAAR